jgi:Flp pilus assembly CpaF family ATPase
MSIIESRLRKDKDAQMQAEKKVENMAAIKPSDKELAIVDEIVDKISKIFKDRIAAEGITSEVKNAIMMQLDKELQNLPGDYEERSRIKRLVSTSMFGLGPLEVFMKPGSKVTDIVVQRYDSICIEDETGMHRIPAQFNNEQHLLNVIQRIVQEVGRQINLSSPTVNAKLADGSRIHATIPPISPDGATLTIRRFNNTKLEAEDYLRLGTLNEPMLEFLKNSVLARLNIIVCGGTGSGKTTLLNMLSSFIPENELIITVEDNCELQLRQPNVRRLEARESIGDMEAIDIQALVKETLRMRPDRIVVGEVRDGTVVDMFSAMSTGHEGSMSTIHTDSPEALIGSRLPTLFSQYKGGSFTQETQKFMTAEALNLIVQISREPGGKRKITHITAVDGIDPVTQQIRLCDIFTYDRQSDTFNAVNPPPNYIIKKFNERKLTFDRNIFRG